MTDLSEVPDIQQRAAELGAKPALIERFGIRNLYKYRTISLTSQYAATILIAKNGTGKTTLLGALDAFLKLQLYRLRELEFGEIFCRLRGQAEELILTHEDLVGFLQLPEKGEFPRFVSRMGLESQRVFQFLMSDFNSSLDSYYDDYDTNSIVNTIVRSFSSDLEAARKACAEVHASLFQRNPRIAAIRETIRTVLADHEIV